MRLDHLLSKGKVRSKGTAAVQGSGESIKNRENSPGVDASVGNTRSHPEHEGQDADGRWYYTGDGMGEQEDARVFLAYTFRSGGDFRR